MWGHQILTVLGFEGQGRQQHQQGPDTIPKTGMTIEFPRRTHDAPTAMGKSRIDRPQPFRAQVTF
eukprot:6753830-Pyramimonas_sp.AAC.1